MSDTSVTEAVSSIGNKVNMFTDSHSHTLPYSPDARMTIDKLVAKAKSLGIPRVGITEHYEIDMIYPDDEVMLFDLDEYDREFLKWQSDAPQGLTLLKGIEFGYQSHTARAIDIIASCHDFDVVILSNHNFRGEDVYFSKIVYDVPLKDRHAEYIGIMAEMCENCDNFDIAAHYDYINRYNPDDQVTVRYEDCPSEFDRFFEALITKNKSLEINTSSINSLIKKKNPSVMPDPAILKRYQEMGGSMITLSSDAHSAEALAQHFDITAEYLKSLGFKENTYFIKHVPHREAL